MPPWTRSGGDARRTPPKGTVELTPGRLAGPERAGRVGGTSSPARLDYAGHRFAAEVIGRAVRPHFHLPLGPRHADGLLATRGVTVGHETARQWGFE